MALPNQKNVLHVLVSKGTSVTAATTLIDNYADLQDGEIAIVDQDNKTLTAAGDNITDIQNFRFVARYGTSLLYTPFLNNSKIVSAVASAYSAPAQQVSYIGYVGSGTGNIEAIDLNEYIVRVLVEGTESTFGNKQMYKFGAYKSGNTAYSADIAIGLTGNLAQNFKREPIETIKFSAICNVAVDAAYDFTQSFVAIAGENYITTGDLAYNTAAGTLAVGDYIRVADDGLNGTLALTDTVYQVIAISGTTKVTLDRPWTNASGTWTDAGDGAQVIPSATGLAANWGIKCTGIAWTNYKEGVFNYGVTRFKLEPQNCGSTAVTYSTAPAEGKGTYGQIAYMEWFAQGNLGNKWRITTPPATMLKNAVDGYTYETLMLKIKDQQGDSAVGAAPASYIEIFLAFKVDSSDGDSVKAALEDLSNVAFTAW